MTHVVCAERIATLSARPHWTLTDTVDTVGPAARRSNGAAGPRAQNMRQHD
ncbi:hypothetical protein [Streptomyces sp. NPDC059378]|uniref:hypothetical protein n=1 Tax=Streptomyces sp. NPDC059378 TaxID=3346815 RepID=UPI0036AA9011